MQEQDLKKLVKEVIREYISEKKEVKEVAPPGFGPDKEHSDIYKKVKSQYPGEPEKQYATMWKIYNQMSEEKTNEAGLTSEKEENDHSYSEEEEVKLIKGLSAIINRLLKMHGSKNIKEGGPQYKVVSPNATDTSIEDKAREIQYDPLVSETKKKNKTNLTNQFKKGLEELKNACDNYINGAGPQYKVVSPNSVDTAKEDKARKIQGNPKVQENHKVQHRSAKTVKDLDNDPNNVRDSEVPQA